MVYRCLFEQSGTFRNVFRSKGLESYDYDISNDFGSTDFIVDLFSEIEKAYKCESSLFDSFVAGDYVLAFFPCTYFCNPSYLLVTCSNSALCNLDDLSKLSYSLNREKERSRYYSLLCMLCAVCLMRNLKLIVENPYSHPNYLTRTFPIKPTVIHTNRKLFGDYFEKPTQYFFIGCAPKSLVEFTCFDYFSKTSIVSRTPAGISRSRISPYYAEYFINNYIC